MIFIIMKVFNILFIIFLSLINTSFITKSDNVGLVSAPLVNGYNYETINYIDWKPSGSGYWTQNNRFSTYHDFDHKITRSKYPMESDGYYYYDFWFFSQSYYWDGKGMSYTWTNIRNITISVDGKVLNWDYTPLGITFFDTFNAPHLRVKTKSKNPFIWITWENMNAI